jgi:hypothetical protein
VAATSTRIELSNKETRQQECLAPCEGLLRGAGADQEARQQPEIVSGDVEEIAFVNVVAAGQPGPAHAAAI